jgi:hypothetical protein
MIEASERPGTIAYIRQSTSPRAQRESDQRRAIQRWARRARTRISGWHVEEAELPALADRPAIMRALSSLAGSGSRVLCVSQPEVLDDAHWAQLVVEHLAVHVGGRVVYASVGAAVVDRPAEVGLALEAYEKMLLRLRAMTAAGPKLPPGPLWGRSPWGYRLSSDGMRLEPYEPEQATLFVVRHMRLRGLKLREIAEELKELGIVGRTGRPLGITRIYKLLDEGKGSKQRALMRGAPAAEDDPPPESRLIEKYPTAMADNQRRDESAAK